MQHFRTDIRSMENLEEPSDSFDMPTEAMTTALPLLYQSGYLTIKDYDRDSQMYTLAIPNQEVRIGYTKGLLPTYIGLDTGNVQAGFALKFWRALKQHNLDLALQEMQAYLAGIPYVVASSGNWKKPPRRRASTNIRSTSSSRCSTCMCEPR